MQSSPTVIADVAASERKPADGGSRGFYTYAGKSVKGVLNGSSQVAQQARIVEAWNPAATIYDEIDQISSWTYNTKGNVLTATDPAGRITKYEYDGTGIDLRYIKQQEGIGVWKVLEERIYGGTGASPHQPTTIKSASGDVTTYQYNSYGQVTLVTNPKSEKTRNNYNGNGWLTSVEKTDPANAVAWVTVYTVNARDAFARVQQDTDDDGYTKTYAYDALNRPTLIPRAYARTSKTFKNS